MSSRLKERGGAGGKAMPAKPHLSAADKPFLKIPSYEKENQRSISVGRSSIARHRSVDPADKSASAVRWSTSSIPKTRAPSLVPSALRASSDLKNSRSSVLNVGLSRQQSQTGIFKGASTGKPKGSVVSDDLGKKGSALVGISRREGERRSVSVGRSAQIRRTSSNVASSTESHVIGSSRGSDLVAFHSKVSNSKPLVGRNSQLEKRDSALGQRKFSGSQTVVENGCANGQNISSVMESRKVFERVKGLENGTCGLAASENTTAECWNLSNSVAVETRKSLDGKRVFEGRIVTKDKKEDGGGSEGYTNKLHEKLAFLEGKVQKIASDIKKTKEMLDLNNTDASKAMLSDIQQKIMGIEKAVGHVIGRGQGELCLDVSSKEQDGTKDCTERSKALESRFVPQEKLLKCDAVAETQRERKKFSVPSANEYNSHLVTGEEMRDIDTNPIAMEFLNSLNGGFSKNISRNKERASDNAGCSGGNSVQMNLVSDENESVLIAEEKLDDLDDQENKPVMLLKEESDEPSRDRLFEIGHKISTGGWFFSEGEVVLLTHGDGSCTYFDVANNEEKCVYAAPSGLSQNLWGDCWLIRAPGVDGCSGKYVVAASAGNVLESGFCSWDFYKKDIQAFRVEQATTSSVHSSSRKALVPISNVDAQRRTCSYAPIAETQQWWYRPCGYLILSTSSCQNIVSAYDLRDGALSMTWSTHDPVAQMEHSCPMQWRSRGKVIIAGTDTISVWDVNSLNPLPLQSLSCNGKNVLALHVNSTDAELGGGVRQRVSSSEAEGNDGVFCTSESMNIIDLRHPTGVGLKLPFSASNPHSIFSRGDCILLGCTDYNSASKSAVSMIQSFSIRKAKLAASYMVPGSADVHTHHSSMSQVWGNSNLVMGISGMGLSVFDVEREETRQFARGREAAGMKEMVGPDDLYRPSFDYIGGRVLLISRDRPAMWRYLP